MLSDTYEFEGKTRDEAIRRACHELGVEEDQLEIEVLSCGSTGIFGLVGAKKAKVKVVLKATGEVASRTWVETEAEAPGSPEEAEEVAELARKTLERIVSAMVDDASVQVESGSGGVRLKIGTSNPAIIIGRHGRTLDAIQYIVRRVVRKQRRTKVAISFDVEGYRDRRKESLTQLALRLGEKVKRSGKPATISPMNPYDRRIVHIALKDDACLKTQSKGGGLFRELIIFPEKRQK